LTEGGANESLTPPIHEGDSPYTAHLLADHDALSTEDAQVVIAVKERVAPLDRKTFVSIGKMDFFKPDITSDLLQLATPVFRANKAGIRVFGKDEFKDVTPKLSKLWCVSLNNHPISGWCSAGCGQAAHFLNLDDA